MSVADNPDFYTTSGKLEAAMVSPSVTVLL